MEQPIPKPAWTPPVVTPLTACESRADVGDTPVINGVSTSGGPN